MGCVIKLINKSQKLRCWKSVVNYDRIIIIIIIIMMIIIIIRKKNAALKQLIKEKDLVRFAYIQTKSLKRENFLFSFVPNLWSQSLKMTILLAQVIHSQGETIKRLRAEKGSIEGQNLKTMASPSPSLYNQMLKKSHHRHYNFRGW